MNGPPKTKGRPARSGPHTTGDNRTLARPSHRVNPWPALSPDDVLDERSAARVTGRDIAEIRAMREKPDEEAFYRAQSLWKLIRNQDASSSEISFSKTARRSPS